MNTHQKAANEIKKLSVMFEGLIALSAELERIGSLEQVASEAETRANRARAEAVAVRDGLDATKKQAAEIEREAKQAASKVEADANALLTKARSQGDDIMADARRKAGATLAEANERASAVDADTGQARHALDSLRRDVADAARELSALQQQMAEIRERAKAFVS